MPIRAALVLSVLSLSLTGCGWFDGDDPKIIFDDRVGPNTKELAKTLPEGLVGDTENRRYSGETLRAEEIFKPMDDNEPPQ